MIATLIRYIFRLRNRDRIPKLPRGMLATHYDYAALDEHSIRVMARLGIRDPLGLKRAMKRYKAKTVDELVGKIEHQSPTRKIRERAMLALGRAVGGSPTPPHRKEIIAACDRDEDMQEVNERFRRVKETFK
jgi:hypothetical protein